MGLYEACHAERLEQNPGPLDLGRWDFHRCALPRDWDRLFVISCETERDGPLGKPHPWLEREIFRAGIRSQPRQTPTFPTGYEAGLQGRVPLLKRGELLRRIASDRGQIAGIGTEFYSDNVLNRPERKFLPQRASKLERDAVLVCISDD
jgi:hypothetical protein